VEKTEKHEQNQQFLTQKAMTALEIYKGSAYLTINKEMLQKTGPTMAVFICNLLDKFDYFLKRNMLTEDGEFFLTHKTQMEQTGMTEYEIKKCKKELKKLDVLQTKRKGTPAKEYYYVDLERLLDTFMPPIGASSTDKWDRIRSDKWGRIRSDIKEPINKENKYNNNITSSTTNDKQTIQERTIEFLPFAEKLARIICLNKNINITPSKINSWANEIRKLNEIDKVSHSRIKEALDWYEDNIGKQYVPVIESGISMRNKFIKLEEAMKRSGHTFKNKKPYRPERVIRRYFRNKDLTTFFYRDCYLPAEGLFDRDVDKNELAQTLVDLHIQISKQQEKYITPELQKLLPGPIDIVARYIAWIDNSTWLKNFNLQMFNISHALFTQYRRDEAEKDNKERDPLTGKSYIKG